MERMGAISAGLLVSFTYVVVWFDLFDGLLAVRGIRSSLL
jgi:hypothetical protein